MRALGNPYLCTALCLGTAAGLVVLTGAQSPTPVTSSASAPTVDASVISIADAPTARETWHYDESSVPTGGISRSAWVTSGNSVNFDFPYGGPQHGTLTLRNDPRWGVDVIFGVEKGHILCNDYRNQSIAVRFDDEPATAVRCGEPDDHSIEYVFLDRESWLIDKARRADKLTLGITFYQEGVRYFTFDIAGLDASKIGIGKPAKSSGVLPTPVARPALPATASAE